MASAAGSSSRQAPPKPTKFSTEAKLNEFDSLGVKNWFEKDLESKNKLVLEAKLKGASGLTKAKVSLDPVTQKESLIVSEEIEVSTNIQQNISGLFKVEAKEISAHLDFGHHEIAGNWFNPYTLFKHARAGGVCTDGATLNFGGITNTVNKWGAAVRHQIELGIALNKLADKPRSVEVKHNILLNYKQYGLHLFQHLDFTGNSKHLKTKLAVSSSFEGFEDYLQVDLNNQFKPTEVSLGASYQVAKGASLYFDASKPVLADKAFLCPVGTQFSVGASYAHKPSGLSAKLAYFHGKRLASHLTYAINKEFTGSLSFDVRY